MDRPDTLAATGVVDHPDTHQSLDAFADWLDWLKLVDLPSARAISNELIARSELLEYSPGVARGRLLQAWCLRLSNDPAAAQVVAEEVVELARSTGNLVAEAAGMLEIGVAMLARGQFRECGQVLAEAVDVARHAADPKVESRIMVAQSSLNSRLDNVDDAITICEQALEMATQANADESIASAMYGLSIVNFQRGDGVQALQYCERLIDIAARTGNVRYRVLALEFKSLIVREHEGNEMCVDSMIDALEFWRRQDDRYRMGAALANIGISYKQIGNFTCALEALLESLELGYQCGDRSGEAVRLLMLAQLYRAIGEEWRELDCYVQSLQRARATGHHSIEAPILLELGSFYQNRGEVARALACFTEAKELVSSRSTRWTQIDLIRQIGCVHVLLGAFDVAEEHFFSALKLARSHDRRRQEMSILRDLGILEEQRGRDSEALGYLTSALALTTSEGFRASRTEILADLVPLCERMGDEASRAGYEREYARLAQAIFSSEQARSLRRIIEQHRNIELANGDVAKGFDSETAQLLRVSMSAGKSSAQESSRTVTPPPFIATFNAWPSSSDRLVQFDRLPVKPVRIRAFGVLEISVDGHVLERRDWSRRRAREMFKLLLVNRDRWLSIDEIHDILWNGKRSKHPDLLVANAVSHLRGAFSAHAGSHDGAVAVECRDGAYRLSLGDNVWVDFHAFKELVFAARRATTAADRMRLYGTAADLYIGDFLAEDQYGDWAALERDTLRSGYLEALEFIATEQRRLAHNDDAIETAWRILRTDPTNRTALEALVCATAAEGRKSEARRILADRAALFDADAEGHKLIAYLSTFVQ